MVDVLAEIFASAALIDLGPVMRLFSGNVGCIFYVGVVSGDIGSETLDVDAL